MSLSRFPDLLARIEDGTTAEEMASLERLAEAAPGHAAAHAALARAYEWEDRREDARRSWQRAHVLLPGNPAVRAGLRRTAAASGSTAAPGATAPDAETAEEAAEERADVARPGERAERTPPPASFENLDDLIQDLESARIEPNPDPADVPAPNLEHDVEDMVSPTLARIYERQGQYTEAARVYLRLADERPGEADEYRRKAEEMDEKGGVEEEENGSEEEKTAGD